MLYSKSNNGFYSTEINGNNIPSDAVEITAEHHTSLLNGQSSGKIITSDDNGYPILVDPPLPTIEEAKESKKADIKASFLSAPLAGLMTSLGFVVDADRQDKSNVEELLDYCIRTGMPGTAQFRIHDNSFRVVSIAELKIIINEIQEFGLGLYATKWQREMAIDAATTEAEIVAITW